MIYLIDDDQYQQQLQNYNATYLANDAYNDILTLLKTEEEVNNHSFDNAKCLLIHNSFGNGELRGRSNPIVAKLEDISNTGSIRRAIFSNQFASGSKFSSENTRLLEEIKKDLFYQNLNAFLKDYKKKIDADRDESNPNLEILAYGTKYNLVKALEIRRLLFLKYLTKQEVELYSYIDDLSKLKVIYSINHKTGNDILNDFDGERKTISDFKKIINQLVENTKHIKNV
jgi:hypothetical protein